MTHKVLIEPRETWFSIIIKDQDSVDHFEEINSKNLGSYRERMKTN